MATRTAPTKPTVELHQTSEKAPTGEPSQTLEEVPNGELPLTPEERNYLKHGNPPLMKEQKIILLKGIATPQEKEFLLKKIILDRKLMSR